MAADYVADVEHSPYLALYEQPALRALLPPVAGRRVLDAGCGAGRHSVWLAEQGAEVVGLDASPEMLARARARVPSGTFAVADLGEPLALGDGAFDVVIASLVLHYLQDWGPTLRELRRVLRPGRRARVLDPPPGQSDRAVTHEGLLRHRARRRPLDAVRPRVRGALLAAPARRHPRRADGAGFGIDDVHEPQPLPECRERFPDVWDSSPAAPSSSSCARSGTDHGKICSRATSSAQSFIGSSWPANGGMTISCCAATRSPRCARRTNSAAGIARLDAGCGICGTLDQHERLPLVAAARGGVDAVERDALEREGRSRSRRRRSGSRRAARVARRRSRPRVRSSDRARPSGPRDHRHSHTARRPRRRQRSGAR